MLARRPMMDDIDFEVWQSEDDPSGMQDTLDDDFGSSLQLQGLGE
jgi:hypothetical protein